jgi:hypothetical protein
MVKVGHNRLIVTRRGSEEIDDRDLLLHRVPEPAVIGCGSVAANEWVTGHFGEPLEIAGHPLHKLS